MSISQLETTEAESITSANENNRKCSFGCKNQQIDCFRELLGILYSKNSKAIYSQESIIKILFNKYFFRLQFHEFLSFENYFKEAEKRGLIRIKDKFIF